MVMNRTECIGRRDDESHVFVCPACRADARIANAWKALRVEESPQKPGERFVRRVLVGIEHDRIARRRRRWIAAAAAAALFSFCAGLAHENASAQPAASPEDEYASLATPSTAPSALDGLIPN
jgi:hypothetical protein